jgi:hypothetical protein
MKTRDTTLTKAEQAATVKDLRVAERIAADLVRGLAALRSGVASGDESGLGAVVAELQTAFRGIEAFKAPIMRIDATTFPPVAAS